ncbi:MAG: molecular chaperone TorD family protein [Cutibacterium granulosum]|uniref:TorD/DmsD family molecular chaperone n=1 Tax=Cutibacterium granulosum TaxID=33011 RepID=UPI002B239321|nr:molecular chaperone TorD family protein [Cutibacterium granulosum]MEA5660038.1 molecular chaperone TorD family protein [Cutibacterium granulosum]MEA5661700.1 molecular chaperone TorD family protein [Cutibacterium granulosum]
MSQYEGTDDVIANHDRARRPRYPEGISNDDLDSYAAVFTTLGSLHCKAPEPTHLTKLLQMIDEWPLIHTPVRETKSIAGPSEEDLGLTMWRHSRDNSESHEEIVVDHDRLYGDSAVALTPPYESVHRNREGLVLGEHTLQVRATYAQLGLAAPNINREPDDHIGLELEFLAQGCLRCLDARDENSAKEAHQTLQIVVDFLHAHVLTWAPAFLDSVVTQAQTSFMKGVALLSSSALSKFKDHLIL